MYSYYCTIERVIDGDTVIASIDLGFSCFYRSAVRLKGIDTPEVTGATKEAGLAAATYLRGLLSEGPIRIVTVFDKDKDKYGRVLGTFYAKETNVNEAMIAAGHAVPYGK